MKKMSIALILTTSLLLLPAIFANMTIFTDHTSLMLQSKNAMANDICYECYGDDFLTPRSASDNNLLPKAWDASPESAVPPVHVMIMLLGMGIVGFASLQR